MRYEVELGGRSFDVVVEGAKVTVGGRAVAATLAGREGSPVRGLLVDGRSYGVVAERGPGGSWKLMLRGRPVDALVVDPRARAIRDMGGKRAAAKGPRPIVAPMPGMVVKVEVAEGDRVEVGQGVVIVEAMKMENELRADGAGIVTGVHVRAGEAVEKNQILVDLAPLGEAPS